MGELFRHLYIRTVMTTILDDTAAQHIQSRLSTQTYLVREYERQIASLQAQLETARCRLAAAQESVQVTRDEFAALLGLARIPVVSLPVVTLPVAASAPAAKPMPPPTPVVPVPQTLAEINSNVPATQAAAAYRPTSGAGEAVLPPPQIQSTRALAYMLDRP